MTAEREAWFQGSRLRLDVNTDAAVRLRDALDRIVGRDPTGASALARLDVRLPDGRPLRLSVRASDLGTSRDRDGAYRSSQGVACVDVSGDFDAHVAVRRVLDAATRPYLEAPTSELAAAELDAARVGQALDGHPPAPDALEGGERDAVRARARRAAGRSRDQRIADAARRHRQLGLADHGLWDR